MKYASDFRADARRALAGRWGLALATALVAALLCGGSLPIPSFTTNIHFTDTGSEFSGGFPFNWAYYGREFLRMLEYSPLLRMALVSIGSLTALIGIAQFVIGGPIELGHCAFNLNMLCGYEAKINDLFSYFNIFGKAFCMRLLRTIYIFLWTLLFIIPGIVKSYSYAMAPYILAAYPGTDANDAITRSRELMRGNKWRLFCLDLSFIGWTILCVLSLGIGFLWLNPYIQAAHASFYLEIASKVPVQPVPQYTAY